MSESKFKTLRHIETVRNYINAVITELMYRQENHDQSKLEPPEVEIFEEFTPKLRDLIYGSNEYFQCLKGMKPAIDHHNSVNRHHPEFFDENTIGKDGINGMNLIDLIEMLCDWKASGMRMNKGDLFRSLEINKGRFNIGEQLMQILENTAKWINSQSVYHKANES